MKIWRKKRIINKNNNKSVNVILISHYHTYNPKKKINVNYTFLYYHDTFIEHYKSINDIYSKINKSDIIDIITIDTLHIVLLNHSKLNKSKKINIFNKKRFIDFLIPQSDSIYNDIYYYNQTYKNTYLNNCLKNNNIELKLIDLYYYLIGYI